ncbi:hypothetical protein M0R45_015471 [Rubus argutus]|uniref:Uncharacterized protein n=1 Tax=Rubus argutus TaxID=59490 RepID=A0AAW1XPR7_RUBAR
MVCHPWPQHPETHVSHILRTAIALPSPIKPANHPNPPVQTTIPIQSQTHHRPAIITTEPASTAPASSFLLPIMASAHSLTPPPATNPDHRIKPSSVLFPRPLCHGPVPSRLQPAPPSLKPKQRRPSSHRAQIAQPVSNQVSVVPPKLRLVSASRDPSLSAQPNRCRRRRRA